jgi:antitoxin component YwqK of YwqJK toxin-antitoxin module
MIIEHGVWINCYPSQKLQDYTRFKNGKNLESLSWDTLGNIILQNGNGYRLSMNYRGEMIRIINYKNYQLDGKYEEIFLSIKQKLCEGYYKHGRPIGKWTYWNQNGSLNRVEKHPE